MQIHEKYMREALREAGLAAAVIIEEAYTFTSAGSYSIA